MCKRNGTALIGNLLDVLLPTLGDCAVCFMWLSGSLYVAGRRREDPPRVEPPAGPVCSHSEERNNGRLVCALHYSFQRHLVGFHGDVLIHPAGPQRTNERTDALVGLPANRQIWHSGISTPTDLLDCWLMRPHPRPCRPRPHNHKIFFPIRTINGNLFVFASELVAGCLRIFLLLLCKYPYVGIYCRVCVLTCIRGQF